MTETSSHLTPPSPPLSNKTNGDDNEDKKKSFNGNASLDGRGGFNRKRIVPNYTNEFS